MIKAHIIWHFSVQFYEASTTSAAPLRNVKLTSLLSEVETDSQSDVIDRVVGSSSSSLSDESLPETDFIPEACAENITTVKTGTKAGTG